jgi:pimeloyl-ACP methyl ester carboxylesterase
VPFLEIDDVRLFFTDDGEQDPPVLLVHGYTADTHDWSWQIPELVASHRVIAVDLRGHGRSSAPSGGYTTHRFATDLAELLEHLQVGPVVAVGHSMGGNVVSALAVEHPERVLGVVAVDPAYLLPDEQLAGIQPLLDLINATDPVPLVQQLVTGLDSNAIDPAVRCWHGRRVAGLEPQVIRQSLEAQVTGMALFSQSDPYLRRRQCPVLAFYADPSRAAAERAVTADSRSRVVTWEGAGHWLQQERPAEFNQLLRTWIASLA